MSDLSTAIKQALARAKTSTRHLLAVELQHTTMPNGVIRLVNYDDDITVDSRLFVGHAMEVRQPNTGVEPANQVTIKVDGVAGTFQFYINQAVQTGTSVLCDIRPFLYNVASKSVIDSMGTFSYKVASAEYDMNTAVLTLGHVSPTNQPFPGKTYSADVYPSIFR